MRPRTSRALPALNFCLAATAGSRDPDATLDKMLLIHRLLEADDAAFIRDMRFQLHQVAAVDNLTAFGWAAFTSDISGRIANRARVRRMAKHPEVKDERIEAPIIVVGLPRTATTLTHHILAGAQGVRAPMLWEWMHTSIPLPERTRRRIVRDVDIAMQLVGFLAPAMKDIHPQSAEQPDECAFFLPHTEGALARAPMPEYEQWLKVREFRADYEYLRQGLQVLQYGRLRKRWVLKCPTHLAHLDELIRQFPDATIVWTHRDPVTVVGSICSLVETSRAMHLRRLGTGDLHDIGRMALSTMSGLVERGRNARTKIPRDRFIDLRYPKLTADPVGEIQGLYDKLDLPWTAKDAARVDEATRRRPGRRHEYTIDRYGLDESLINAAFGDYGHLADLPGLGGA